MSAPADLAAAIGLPAVRVLDRLPFTAPTAAIPEAPAPPAEGPVDRLPELPALRLLAGGKDSGPGQPAPERPIVLDEGVGEPLTQAAFSDGVVRSACEMIAMHGRHRALRPLGERAATEDRVLTYLDAIAVTGGACVATILAWWEESLEVPDPWKTWTAALALGTLDGADALEALTFGLRRLPPALGDHAAAAAEALAALPRPDLGALSADLRAAPEPLLRSAGVELAARLTLLAPDALSHHFADPSPLVVAAAARAAARLRYDEAEPLLPWIEAAMRRPDARVAWPAARSMMRWGRLDAYEELRAGAPLGKVLGLRAAELLVMAGEPADLTRLEAILARAPTSPAHLSVIARFGHPAAWARLLHHLGDPDLEDAAVLALTTLFGAAVPHDDRADPAAWKSALLATKWDPLLRYRRGEPWRAEIVAAEVASGALPPIEVEARLDELLVRTRAAVALGTTPSPLIAPCSADVSLWAPHLTPALAGLGAAAARAAQGRAPGRWR
jgi:hypothetical protein